MTPTIVCVYRTGGDYGPEWVTALRRQVQENTSIAHDFRCLSDDPAVGMWRIPLEHDWPGWWSKVEAFRPGLFRGPVLYLDLDTLVVGDLAPLLRLPGEFHFLGDLYQPEKLASGVVYWHGDALGFLYQGFRQDPEGIQRAHRSRSDHWYRKVVPAHSFIQEEEPGLVFSLKREAQAQAPPGAAVVCGHGHPRLSHQRAGWANKRWGEYAGR